MQEDRKKDQPLDTGEMGGLNDICFNREIIEEEIRGVGLIGKDSANLGRGEDDDIRLGACHPLPDSVLLAQIDIAAVHCQEFRVILCEAAQDRRANHSAMAGDPDLPFAAPWLRRKM